MAEWPCCHDPLRFSPCRFDSSLPNRVEKQVHRHSDPFLHRVGSMFQRPEDILFKANPVRGDQATDHQVNSRCLRGHVSMVPFLSAPLASHNCRPRMQALCASGLLCASLLHESHIGVGQTVMRVPEHESEWGSSSGDTLPFFRIMPPHDGILASSTCW